MSLDDPVGFIEFQALSLRTVPVVARLDATVETFSGPQGLHRILERTTWHAAQHCRQLAMVVGVLGPVADEPLAMSTLNGLPMPADVLGS